MYLVEVQLSCRSQSLNSGYLVYWSIVKLRWQFVICFCLDRKTWSSFLQNHIVKYVKWHRIPMSARNFYSANAFTLQFAIFNKIHSIAAHAFFWNEITTFPVNRDNNQEYR